MDEILIEEKKYVSSKRAAKITGYAKDYIGQLCREGRVPARLVGRSWYVLESAIQDHRFGDHLHEGKVDEVSVKPIYPSTWETPRYEASVIESIPPVNRLQDSSVEEVDGSILTPRKEERIQEESASEAEDSTMNNEDVRVPIHTVYETLPEEFLPRSFEERLVKSDMQTEPEQVQEQGTKLYGVMVTMLCLVALPFVIVAVIGTGYLDNYVSKIELAKMVSGMHVYFK